MRRNVNMGDILFELLNELLDRADMLNKISKDTSLPKAYRVALEDEVKYLIKVTNDTSEDINESIRLSEEKEEDLRTLKHNAQFGI